MFFFFQQSEKKNREKKSVLEGFSNRAIKLVFFFFAKAKGETISKQLQSPSGTAISS